MLSLFFCFARLEADGWANDWPESLHVVGLPDLRLFPGDDRAAPLRYGGDRNVEAILAWLRGKVFHTLVPSKKEL